MAIYLPLTNVGVGSNYPTWPAQANIPQPVRQAMGNAVEWVGGKLGIPETGISEAIAGGPTKKTNQATATAPTETKKSLGASGSWSNDTINNMVSRGGYDLKTAQQVYAADPTRFENEFSNNALLDAQRRYEEEQNRLRNQISSGWDEYISSLDRQLNEGLPAQQGNLTGIVNNQFQQGLGSLGVSRDTGLTNLQGERESLEANQSKNLRDLAENLRNMFMAGNVYLGSRGAGDSSASNMYSYALGKVGTKARSDVMNQTSQQMAEIGRRETNLNTIYEQEKRNLETERDNKIYEIANWFETQKNALLSQKGQAGLQKSQDLANLTKDLLNQAMTALQNVQSQVNERNQALDSWAISNAQNINQLKSNLQQVGTFKANLPQGQLTGGTPQISGGNVYTPINWSTNTSNEERDIWGNIIR